MKLHVNANVRWPLTLAALMVGVLFTFAAPSWGAASCPNEQFRTGPGAYLPDCRAYEQVSPQEKNGGSVDGGLSFESDLAPDQAALNGESITYASQTAFADANPLSALPTSQYISRRTPSGWTTEAVTPRQALEKGKVNLSFGSSEYSPFTGFTPDLAFSFVKAGAPAPGPNAPAGYDMPYLRNNATGGYTVLSTMAPPVVATGVGTCCRGLNTEFAGASDDGRQVIFEANDALTPEAIPGHVNLYEWNEGSLELVNVLPDGKVVEDWAKTLGQSGVGGEAYGFGGPSEVRRQGEYFNFDNAISKDGKRVFWSGGDGHIYMREATAEGHRVLDISASQKTNGSGSEGPLAAHYWGASASGELVYFTSPERLTNDATSIYEPLHHEPYEGDLYQYDVATKQLTDLTLDEHDGERAGVQGVLGLSEDGSYVYFAAYGVLAAGAKQGSPSEQGPFNIYVWHDGEIKLVGTTTRRNGYYVAQEYDIEAFDWNPALNARPARVSPNGRYLAFTSTSTFGRFNTEPATATSCGVENIELETTYYLERLTEDGAHCGEVYEYDAVRGELSCASCDPRGLPSTGNSMVPHSVNLVPATGWQTNTEQQRYLFDNGRLFFDSMAGLVARDTNDREDVYEYEPPGVGGCTGAKSCLSLISGGTGTKETQFMDADAEGDNAFLVTFDHLSPSDGDEDADVYDARVGGGFYVPPAPPCQGEACKAAVTGAPAIYGAPTSETFSGGGNVANGSSTKASTPKKTVKKKRKKKKAKKGKKTKKRKARRSRVLRGNGRGK